MRRLREPINDNEQDSLAIDAREPLDEVHGHVRPNGRGQPEWPKESHRLQVFRLVPLTHSAGAHIILDGSARAPGARSPLAADEESW
jgi:hypothetical protein